MTKQNEVLKENSYRKELEIKKGDVKCAEMNNAYKGKVTPESGETYWMLKAIGKETEGNVKFEEIIGTINLLGIPAPTTKSYSTKRRPKKKDKC